MFKKHFCFQAWSERAHRGQLPVRVQKLVAGRKRLDGNKRSAEDVQRPDGRCWRLRVGIQGSRHLLAEKNPLGCFIRGSFELELGAWGTFKRQINSLNV